MDTKELHKLPLDGLMRRLTESATELSRTRFAIASGESKLVRNVRRLRLERAQLLTELRSRESAGQKT